jgi:hypothetical protein
MAISEERLSAFIEGDLSPDERAAVEAAIAQDPALAQRVRAERALRARIARLHRTAKDQPPSERLIAVGRSEGARAAELIDLSAARAERVRQRRAPIVRKWSRRAVLVAVGLLGVFVAGEFLLNPGQTPLIAAGEGDLVARGALAQALTNRLSAATPANGALRIGPSFLSTDQAYCRDFMIAQGAGLTGVACREPGGWRIRLAAEAAFAASAPYRASVAAMTLGQPLDAQAEAAARAKGWRA